MPTTKVRLVCISDTHNYAPGQGYTLPKGDILIHGGDLTNQGSYQELKKAVDWLVRSDFPVKIVVAGNHDLLLDAEYNLESNDHLAAERLLTGTAGITYLRHEEMNISLPHKNVNLRVFGSPFSPNRGSRNWAFQYENTAAHPLWTAIPNDSDIVITHSPPLGHCDASQHWTQGGCAEMKKHLARSKPRLHICGHCHEGRGAETIRWNEDADDTNEIMPWIDPGKGNKKQSLLDLTSPMYGEFAKGRRTTTVVNASIMAKSYGRGSKEFNKPIVVDLSLNTTADGLHQD